MTEEWGLARGCGSDVAEPPFAEGNELGELVAAPGYLGAREQAVECIIGGPVRMTVAGKATGKVRRNDPPDKLEGVTEMSPRKSRILVGVEGDPAECCVNPEVVAAALEREPERIARFVDGARAPGVDSFLIVEPSLCDAWRVDDFEDVILDPAQREGLCATDWAGMGRRRG